MKKNIPKGGTSLDGPSTRGSSLDRPIAKAIEKTEKNVIKPIAKATEKVGKATDKAGKNITQPIAKATENTKKAVTKPITDTKKNAKDASKKVTKVTKNVKDVKKNAISLITGKKNKNCCDRAMESIGEYGFDILGTQRMPIAIINIILSVLTFCLYCVALAGTSTDEEDNIRNSAWATHSTSTTTSYYGLYMYVSYNKNDKFIKNSDVEYSDKICSSNACDVCEDAGEVTTAFLAMSFILIFPIGLISFLRMYPEMFNINKFIVFIALLLSILFIIISMSTFASCHDEIVNAYDKISKSGDKVEYGPGFVCLSLNLVTCFIMFFLHLFIKSS
jgi:vacuolar-type H+-ATPase subunit H